MRSHSIMKMAMLIFFISIGIVNTNAQTIRELFDQFNGKNINLVYKNIKEGAKGESTLELYFTDSKNIMLFKMFDTYCLEVNFTEGYIVPNSFDFEEFKIIEPGAKIHAYITIENNEIVIKPTRNKNLEIRILIKKT